MALNIPMPESPGSSLLKGLDTGSSMMSRMMQPILERERLKQQQNEFIQDYALKKQAENRASALMPYMIQQYQDTHRTAASEAQIKELYQSLIKDALDPKEGGMPIPPHSNTDKPVPGMPNQMGAGQPNTPEGIISPFMGNTHNSVQNAPMVPNQNDSGQEQELRAGNPRLARLDRVAGLMPGIPKPAIHYANGMIFTSYPSGRMTVQRFQGQETKTPGEKNVSAKEASKIRDQATALINSANLVQQGYGLLGDNPDLTGPGNVFSAIPIPFSGGSKINLSSNPELGKFTTVTGKLQAELARYAATKGGIQAIKWVGNVKPSPFNSQDYNYGMFEGLQKNLEDDYDTLNQQYKASTGQDLPIPLPKMTSNRGTKRGKAGAAAEIGKGKVTKWKMTGGQLVKE